MHIGILQGKKTRLIPRVCDIYFEDRRDTQVVERGRVA